MYFDKNVKKWPHIIAEIVFKHVVQQDKCTNYKTLGGWINKSALVDTGYPSQT